MNPIMVVLNNSGFGTERPMIDGPFNDVAPWHYHRIPEITGGGKGYLVTTEKEFSAALADAKASREPSLIEAILDPLEISPQLRRMCERLAQGVKH
jgi:indolepyruvate decarboxylase